MSKCEVLRRIVLQPGVPKDLSGAVVSRSSSSCWARRWCAQISAEDLTYAANFIAVAELPQLRGLSCIAALAYLAAGDR